MKLRPILTPIVSFLVLLIFGGCTQEPKYRIGVSQCSDDDWRHKINDEIMREVLLHDDIYIEILSADDDSEKQKADLRHFASGDFDIIIASPNEVDAVTPVLDSIYKAGVPLILFDRRTNTDHYTAFQGADNRALGRAVGKYAQVISTAPRILEIEGNLDTSPAIDRHDGFMDYIAGADNMQVLACAVGEWTTPGGKRIADSLLAVYPDANIIYAHNDRMAIGAAEVLDSLRRRDIKIIGIDATPEIGLKAVLDSVIDATFIYPSEGRQLIKTALAILNGEEYQKNLIIPTCTAVDLSNAEIMYVQNQAIKEETKNIHELKSHLNTYWKQHSAQTTLLYASVIILVMLAGVIFLLLRNYSIQRRSKTAIEKRNQLLSSQSQEIKEQNRQLQLKNDEINQMFVQLQQATQSKLTFFTNVSHDLRTPLTLIVEPVAQLQNATNLTSDQHRLMNLCMKNIKILMRLINQILDLRKYENAKLDINLTEVNLVSELRDWTEAFGEVAKKRHLRFKVDMPQDTDRYEIAIDIDKIERVVFNLLANAFKFTPDNGNVKVQLYRDNNNMYISVSDTGKGISTDDIDKVFERFFKADKVSPQGSGIGLALSKAFVELHGGTLTVESAVSKGSKFTVTLPVHHIDSQPVDTLRQTQSTTDITAELADIDIDMAQPQENQDTILVIDDNADICTMIRVLLQDRYTIIEAHDGLQGIKMATKYVPDLIICDMMMPGIDGIETCRRLKTEVTTSHIPVLMLTASSIDEQRIAAYDYGADGYLTKPYSAALLDAQIKSLIENRKRLQIYYMTSNERPSVKPASKEPNKKPTSNSKDIDDAFYQRFVDLVNEYMANSALSVDDIASHLGISRIQLYRKIKALTNYSPTDIIRNMRLQRADFLLKTTDHTVAEIGFKVGFSAHSYFTKCYREFYGESPSEVQHRTSKPK